MPRLWHLAFAILPLLHFPHFPALGSPFSARCGSAAAPVCRRFAPYAVCKEDVVQAARPRPAELQHLRPSNLAGALAVGGVAADHGAGIALALQPRILPWAAGQVVLALALVQWFVVLHECGHDTLFRTRRLHPIVGRIAGAFAAIPYACWTRIHGRHHRWTGWQDLDPTTAALVPRARPRLERMIVNVCWKCSIPLFSIIYRLENYWHLPRLFRVLRLAAPSGSAWSATRAILVAALRGGRVCSSAR